MKCPNCLKSMYGIKIFDGQAWYQCWNDLCRYSGSRIALRYDEVAQKSADELKKRLDYKFGSDADRRRCATDLTCKPDEPEYATKEEVENLDAAVNASVASVITSIDGILATLCEIEKRIDAL